MPCVHRKKAKKKAVNMQFFIYFIVIPCNNEDEILSGNCQAARNAFEITYSYCEFGENEGIRITCEY